MGEGIDFGEVERFRARPDEAINDIFNQNPRHEDSPVYTFLNGLTPPALAEAMRGVAEEVAKAAPVVEAATQAGGIVYSDLMQQVDEAQDEGDFVSAKALLSRLRKKSEAGGRPGRQRPEDPYVVQRLALVTYKSKDADAADRRSKTRGSCSRR